MSQGQRGGKRELDALPQNIDAEESLLGAMMLSPGAIAAVSEELEPGDFYRESHRLIYEAALALDAAGRPVDWITVTDLLEERGELEAAQGKARVAELAVSVPASANARHYARIVHEMAMLRGLISVGGEVTRLGHERPGDVEELFERAERALYGLTQARATTDFVPLESLLKEGWEEINTLYEAKSEVSGLATGLSDLDRMTSGLQPGNLMVIAARPSVGKSALALCIAANVTVRSGLPVGLFTLEMSRSEVTQRLLCSEAKVESQRIRSGRLAAEDWSRLTGACDRLSKARLHVDDSGAPSVAEVRSKARRLKAHQPDLALVVIDYLQLMAASGSAENRVQQVSEISRSLKQLAGELGIPIVALSQLSRAVEARHDRRPLLSDLRESGCLAGDSRVFLPDEGCYRPIADLVGQHGFRVLALNTKTWRLEPREVTRAFATGRKPVYRLRTRLGRTIRATANHKFLALDGWRRLDELRAGSRIALPRHLLASPARTMASEELALLGHLLGNGCTLPRHAIQYTTGDRELADMVAELARATFGAAITPRVVAERTWYQVYLTAAQHLTHGVRNPVAEWFDRLGVFGLRSFEKRVPDAVFRQPPRAIATFLRHLWATDGCLRAGNGRSYPVVRYDSSSYGLSRDVGSLLLRFGINAKGRVSMGTKGRPSHRLGITGRDEQIRFVTHVGCVGARRKSERARILSRLERTTANTNRDVIPREAWRSIVVPAMGAAGVSTRELQARIGTAYCGSSLYRTGIGRPRAAAIAEAVRSEPLAKLAASDVYWDEVVSVEPDGDEQVYDLTVDGLHNFVADDVVVHNSIEQDADLVLFIYRDEVYAEDSEHQGVAELILAKHRSGPTGTVKAAFLKRYALFADLAQP